MLIMVMFSEICLFSSFNYWRFINSSLTNKYILPDWAGSRNKLVKDNLRGSAGQSQKISFEDLETNWNSIFADWSKWKVWCFKYSFCQESSDEWSAFDRLYAFWFCSWMNSFNHNKSRFYLQLKKSFPSL